MDTIEDVFKHFLSRYNAFRQKQFEIIERPQPSLFRTRDAAAGEERSFETYRLDDDEFRSTTKRYLELQKRGLPYEQMVQEMGVGAGASSYRAVEYTLAEAMAGRLATLAQLERPPAPPVTIVLWTDPLSFPEGMFFPSHFEPSRRCTRAFLRATPRIWEPFLPTEVIVLIWVRGPEGELHPKAL